AGDTTAVVLGTLILTTGQPLLMPANMNMATPTPENPPRMPGIFLAPAPEQSGAGVWRAAAAQEYDDSQEFPTWPRRAANSNSPQECRRNGSTITSRPSSSAGTRSCRGQMCNTRICYSPQP